MLYEDDFEFEEQPADLRDRPIPGKSGGGRDGGGTRRRRDPRRSPAAPRERQALPDEAKPARDLLAEILERMGAGTDRHRLYRAPRGRVSRSQRPASRHADRPPRQYARSAQSRLQQRAQCRRSQQPPLLYDRRRRLPRARADQLKHLALATLERCVRERSPQKLEPMLPSERKIVHLALADSEVVRTESEGEEPERRVVIFPR